MLRPSQLDDGTAEISLRGLRGFVISKAPLSINDVSLSLVFQLPEPFKIGGAPARCHEGRSDVVSVRH